MTTAVCTADGVDPFEAFRDLNSRLSDSLKSALNISESMRPINHNGVRQYEGASNIEGKLEKIMSGLEALPPRRGKRGRVFARGGQWVIRGTLGGLLLLAAMAGFLPAPTQAASVSQEALVDHPLDSNPHFRGRWHLFHVDGVDPREFGPFPSIKFEDREVAFVTELCNQSDHYWRRIGRRVEFGPPRSSTLVSCGPEFPLGRLLLGSHRWRMEDGNLVLRSNEGKTLRLGRSPQRYLFLTTWYQDHCSPVTSLPADNVKCAVAGVMDRPPQVEFVYFDGFDRPQWG